MNDAVQPARTWVPPLVLVVLVALAYAVSLRAPFLDYDDDWLIRDNPVLRDGSLDALGAIVADFSRETRLVLGAEYLPVRDLVEWVAIRVVGPSAPALRVLALLLYLGAVLAWRAWFRRLLGPSPVAELAALAFALHPVHAESVAWLAGIKDVLALLFTGLALALYATPALDTRRRVAVVALVLLACFSKAVSVVVPGLLLVSDLWLERRPDRRTLGAAALVAVIAAMVHASIGARVGMYAAMPGGDRLGALATMAPVAFRYALRCVLLEPASIVYEVPDRSLADPWALASLAGLALAFGAAAWLHRRGTQRPLLLLLFAAIALAPVSEVLAPIQHRMADRYLLVAVAAPCLALALVVQALLRERVPWPLWIAVCAVLGGSTAMRATLFADATWLWIEAGERAPASPLGPYQLGVTVEPEDPALAEHCYREALARDTRYDETWRAAQSNLAILLARSGREAGAIALLEEARTHFPRDPRVGHNLAVLLDDRGEHDRARELMLEVMRTSPRYARARSTYRERWGEPPTPAPSTPRYDAGERMY